MMARLMIWHTERCASRQWLAVVCATHEPCSRLDGRLYVTDWHDTEEMAEAEARAWAEGADVTIDN
jgi:hypothetical protein